MAVTEQNEEYVIAATQATALIVAHLIRTGELPRLYHDSLEALEAFHRQPVPMQKRYPLFVCDKHGAATVLTTPEAVTRFGGLRGKSYLTEFGDLEEGTL